MAKLNDDVVCGVYVELYVEGVVSMWDGERIVKRITIPEPSKTSKTMRISRDCRGHLPAPDYIREVIDVGVCGVVALDWIAVN